MQGEYVVLVGVEAGLVGVLPKKKRRRVLVTQKRRTGRDGGATLMAETQREGKGLDETIRREAVSSTAGSNFDGGADGEVVLSPVGERATRALEESMPRVEELEEEEEEVEVPLA